MTSFFKHIALSLSNPITATPNALAFSTPSATQVAPSSLSPLNPEILPPSPSSIMTSGSISRTKKRKRYPGWLCEDEVSEGETALFEMLDAKGQEYNSAPLISKAKNHVERSATPPAVSKNSSGNTLHRSFNLRQRTRSELPSTDVPSSSPLKLRANTRPRETKAKNSRPSQRRILRHSNTISGHPKSVSSRESTRLDGLKGEASIASNIEDQQPPQKRPRFHGYVCEDEAEEDDPALASMIREKGTPFQLKKTNLSPKKSVKPPGKTWNDAQQDISILKTRTSDLLDTSTMQKSRPHITGMKRSKEQQQRPQSSAARPNPSEIRHKARRKTYPSADQSTATKPGPLFPNSASRSRITPPLSTPPSTIPEKDSDKDSTKVTPVARAQQLVKAATSNFKHLSNLSDQAARAAAVAKRKAGDAANRLEEAKRSLRVENEKEKARREGRRFASGWAWIQDDGNDQASEDSRRSRKRSGHRADAETGAIIGHKQGSWGKGALQASTRAEIEYDEYEVEGENGDNIRLDDNEGREEDEDDQEDEDDEDEYGSTTDDGDDDDDDGDGDGDDDEDDFDTSDDEGDFTTGRTADLLG